MGGALTRGGVLIEIWSLIKGLNKGAPKAREKKHSPFAVRADGNGYFDAFLLRGKISPTWN